MWRSLQIPVFQVNIQQRGNKTNTFQINTEEHFQAIQRTWCEMIVQKGSNYEDQSEAKLGKI